MNNAPNINIETGISPKRNGINKVNGNVINDDDDTKKTQALLASDSSKQLKKYAILMGAIKSLNWNNINASITIHKFCGPKMIKVKGKKSKAISKRYHFLKFFSLEIIENKRPIKAMKRKETVNDENISLFPNPAFFTYIGSFHKESAIQESATVIIVKIINCFLCLISFREKEKTNFEAFVFSLVLFSLGIKYKTTDAARNIKANIFEINRKEENELLTKIADNKEPNAAPKYRKISLIAKTKLLLSLEADLLTKGVSELLKNLRKKGNIKIIININGS
ncbi:MAG: hypothetical protein P8Y97_22270 [Candidatus Lokiarchaeota archaeon]